MFRRILIIAGTVGLLITGGVALGDPAAACCPSPPAAYWSSDYNGDGYGDVIVGEAERTVNGKLFAGAVRVVYGSASGLVPSGSQFITKDSFGVPGSSEATTWFGRTVVSGNFDRDQYGDVAIGSGDSDEVVVLYGSSSGLNGTAAAQAKAELLTAAAYVPVPSYDFGFGRALAVGDADHDGYADLAIGSPGVGTNTGGVTVVYGSSSGLDPGGSVLYFTENTPGVPSTGYAGEGFGSALTFGDFNGDNRDDLAVGAPGEQFGDIFNAGAVFVIMADLNGVLTGTGAKTFNQDTLNVPDAIEESDQFGAVLVAGDLTFDNNDELIIGTPAEDIDGCLFGCGLVTLLKGSASGLVATGALSFPGGEGDSYGYSLAVLYAGGNPYGYLAIGAPFRSVNDLDGAGAVDVLPSSASGPTLVGATTWTQDSPGMAETAEAGDMFGSALRSVSASGSYRHLVVGVRAEDVSGLSNAGGLQTIPGSVTGPTATGNTFLSPTVLSGGGVSGAQVGAAIG